MTPHLSSISDVSAGVLKGILRRRLSALDAQLSVLHSERDAIANLVELPGLREFFLALNVVPSTPELRDAIAELFLTKRRNMRVAEIVESLCKDQMINATQDMVHEALHGSQRFVALNRGWWSLAKHRVHHTVRRDTRGDTQTEASMA